MGAGYLVAAGPKAVIFDLDGTLIDSAPDIAAALNVALSQASIAPLDLDTVKSMTGGGACMLVERAVARSGKPADVEKLLTVFLQAYGKHPSKRTKVYPGVRQALGALQADGVRLAVCTNKPHDLTLAILANLDLAHHFEVIVGATPGLRPKPAPDLLRKVLSDLDIACEDAVMAGDSSADVGAARAAGVRVILVSTGYSTVPAMSLCADAVIDGMDALRPELRKLATPA
jgi:phosphoglycolate phosphatase